MSLVGVSSQMGVTSSTLQALIAGQVSTGIAGRLGATSSSLQAFVDRGTSIGLAAAVGCTSHTLQELRNGIGRDEMPAVEAALKYTLEMD